MFGWKLIRSDEYWRFKQIDETMGRLGQANRWLSEFDWFLNPLWQELFSIQGSNIARCREEMRLALESKMKEAP